MPTRGETPGASLRDLRQSGRATSAGSRDDKPALDGGFSATLFEVDARPRNGVPHRPHAVLNLVARTDVIPAARAAGFLRDTALDGDLDFGMAHPTLARDPHHEIAPHPHQLRKGLPDLYWITVFGQASAPSLAPGPRPLSDPDRGSSTEPSSTGRTGSSSPPHPLPAKPSRPVATQCDRSSATTGSSRRPVRRRSGHRTGRTPDRSNETA